MALHTDCNEKTAEGLEVHRDASSPEPTAELPQEMGAFQAYKVGRLIGKYNDMQLMSPI